MTKIKTLKQRLKPEIKAKLESNDRKYSDVVRSLFIKLDKTKFISELKICDIRTLHSFSDTSLHNLNAYDLMWCEHLLMTMTDTTKLQAHDKAFANMHQLSIEMAQTRLQLEGKVSSIFDEEQLQATLDSQLREFDAWNYIATLIEKDYGKHVYVDEILGYQRDYDFAAEG